MTLLLPIKFKSAQKRTSSSQWYQSATTSTHNLALYKCNAWTHSNWPLLLKMTPWTTQPPKTTHHHHVTTCSHLVIKYHRHTHIPRNSHTRIPHNSHIHILQIRVSGQIWWVIRVNQYQKITKKLGTSNSWSRIMKARLLLWRRMLLIVKVKSRLIWRSTVAVRWVLNKKVWSREKWMKRGTGREKGQITMSGFCSHRISGHRNSHYPGREWRQSSTWNTTIVLEASSPNSSLTTTNSQLASFKQKSTPPTCR
jgi:hypothetical protein